ncbi:unnamed protein product [Acanthoscelides obtectus]|uniref:Uncharacterized protein n=1 Tax=Acanthoscelides obtectus TaxID=200917 RepID=A0A9P0Q4S7_ACAOB|nr:unnamed protein product [Acanthoscelides obtectus]CAK1637743.1 hypothetical protein AOBTE_LOCUS10172 [Acanthoscelides obtectus]
MNEDIPTNCLNPRTTEAPPKEAHMENPNHPKLRKKTFKSLASKLNCMTYRLSSSIENATTSSLSSEDTYNKSTTSTIDDCESWDRGSGSSEAEYEEVLYNSIYDTAEDSKMPSEEEVEYASSQNSTYQNQFDDSDVFVEPPPSPMENQNKTKDVREKPSVPPKPQNLAKVSPKQQKVLLTKGSVDVALSYHRLEELGSKSKITSKDVQETLRIVKELENMFHDKVNEILNKFKED